MEDVIEDCSVYRGSFCTVGHIKGGHRTIPIRFKPHDPRIDAMPVSTQKHRTQIPAELQGYFSRHKFVTKRGIT